MKLRLTSGGFDRYTGQMGLHDFVNGLSVRDVLPVDAVRIANVIGAVWEDGTPANVGQMYLDNMKTAAPLGNATTLESAAAPAAPTMPASEQAAPEAAPAPAPSPSKTYTAEELAAVADATGIEGLREIAAPLGLKSNSINGLIGAILKVAGPAPKEE